MDYHFIIGILAGTCSIFSVSHYIPSILRGETKPNRASWIIWNITNIILLISYFSVGARSTIFLPVLYVINSLVILVLCFIYGVSHWTRLDLWSLFVAGVSLIIWFITKNPLIALLMNLFMDSAGYLPTLRKIFYDPSSENRTAWSFTALGSFINLFAINSSSFGVVIYPIVLFTMNTTVLLFFHRKQITSIFSRT